MITQTNPPYLLAYSPVTWEPAVIEHGGFLPSKYVTLKFSPKCSPTGEYYPQDLSAASQFVISHEMVVM